MEIINLVIGVILLITGLVGCILPVIPGPPFAFLALLLGYFFSKPEPYGITLLVVMGIITIAVTVLDYILPSIVAKKYGGSKFGSWGALIGMIAGMFLLPPFGIFIGAVAGAFLGEIIFNPDIRRSIRAGIGVVIGIAIATAIKLSVTGLMGFFFIKGAIKSLI